MNRSRAILIGFAIFAFVFISTFFGFLSPNVNNIESSSPPVISSPTRQIITKKPNSFADFVKKNQNAAKNLGKLSCQSITDESFKLPFGGAECLLSVVAVSHNTRNNNNLSDNNNVNNNNNNQIL